MENHWIIFNKKCFCFTGELTDLSRSEVQNEVKLRNGNFNNRLTNEVDYLVVGLKNSPNWKFGNYGNKINEAVKLREKNQRPLIVSEDDFLEALSLNIPKINTAVIDTILTIEYECYDNKEDIIYLKECFNFLAAQVDMILTVEEIDFNHLFLFSPSNIIDENVIKYKFKLLKKCNSSFDFATITNELRPIIEQFVSDNKKIVFREIKEGTGLFVRYSRRFF